MTNYYYNQNLKLYIAHYSVEHEPSDQLNMNARRHFSVNHFFFEENNFHENVNS